MNQYRQKINEMNSSERYRSYKAGKIWVYAGITSLSLGLVSLFWGPLGLTAEASTTAPDATSSISTSSAGSSQNLQSSSVVLSSSAAENASSTTDLDTSSAAISASANASAASATASSGSEAVENSAEATGSDVHTNVENTESTESNNTSVTTFDDTTVANLEDSTATVESATPVTSAKTVSSLAVTTVVATSNITTKINDGTENAAGTVAYNTATVSDNMKFSIAGTFNAGDVATVTFGTSNFQIVNGTTTDGVTIKTSTVTVNGYKVPVVTYTFSKAFSALQLDIYYKFQDNNKGSLSDGEQYTDVPVSVALNGVEVATNTITVDKTYQLNGKTPSIVYNLFGTNSGKFTSGLLKDGVVTSDITWTFKPSSVQFPGDYSTIPSSYTNIPILSADSNLSFKLPDGLTASAVSIDDTLTAAGVTVNADGQNIVVIYPAGMSLSDISQLAGFINVTIKAVDEPTTATMYSGLTTTMNWNIDGQNISAMDTSTAQRGTQLLRYVEQSIAFVNNVSFNSNANTNLTSLGDNLKNSQVITWNIADASNYTHGGLFTANMTISSSNSETPMGIGSIAGLTDSNLVTSGLSQDLNIVFTTASGKQETQAYTSGTSVYYATIGSSTDPVVGVTLQETSPSTTAITTTTGIQGLSVGIVAYGNTATTLTATADEKIVLPDGTVYTPIVGSVTWYSVC